VFDKLFASAALTVLVLIPVAAVAVPVTMAIGAAQATVSIDPDPPHIGKNHVVVVLSGIPQGELSGVSVAYSTAMPSMGMGGPAGPANMTAPGHFEFDVNLAMAAAWDVAIHLSGATHGAATFHVTVGAASAATAADANSSAAAPAMTGMAGMAPAGDPGAWRTATFALVVILLVGMAAVLLLRRQHAPLAMGITAAAAVLTLGLAALQARYAAPPMDMAAMSPVAGEAPVPVTLAEVRDASESAVFAPGTISPYLTQDIVTRAGGILNDFTAYSGDRLRAGQVVATLEAPDVQSQAAAALADAAAQADSARAAEIEAHHHAPNGVVIANAETSAMKQEVSAAGSDQVAKREQVRYWQDELRRESTLLAAGAVSQQEFQDEQAQSANARAALDAATNRIGALQQQLAAAKIKAMDALASVGQMQAQAASAQGQAARARANALTQTTVAGYLTVTSPSDGTIVKRLVDPGVYVPVGTAIARVAVIDRLRVQANVAQNDLSGIREGTPIDAVLSDGNVVRGRVTSIAPVADPATHTVTVEAIVGNPRTDVVPGGYVRVTLHRQPLKTAGVDVPSAAVIGGGDSAAVWTSVKNIAHRVPVRVLADNGTYATVSGDLRRGTQIVVDGAATLQDGQTLVGRSS
jgi:multidrug efflux pump subunit AcrA (membrane-fusion protein)